MLEDSSSAGAPRPRCGFPIQLVLAAAILAAFPASAGSPIDCMRATLANCSDIGTMASIRRCSATVMCSGPDTNLALISLFTFSNVTSCTPTFLDLGSVGGAAGTATATLVAQALTAAPLPRSCSWFWSSEGGASGPLIITSEGDGLPVELMDFAVE